MKPPLNIIFLFHLVNHFLMERKNKGKAFIGNTLLRYEKGRFPIKFILALPFFSWNIPLFTR